MSDPVNLLVKVSFTPPGLSRVAVELERADRTRRAWPPSLRALQDVESLVLTGRSALIPLWTL